MARAVASTIGAESAAAGTVGSAFLASAAVPMSGTMMTPMGSEHMGMETEQATQGTDGETMRKMYAAMQGWAEASRDKYQSIWERTDGYALSVHIAAIAVGTIVAGCLTRVVKCVCGTVCGCKGPRKGKRCGQEPAAINVSVSREAEGHQQAPQPIIVTTPCCEHGKARKSRENSKEHSHSHSHSHNRSRSCSCNRRRCHNH